MKQQGFAPIIVIVLVAAVLVVGGGVWWHGKNASAPSQESITASTDTSTWKTYRNNKYGFEFQYPPKLIARELDSSFFLKYENTDQETPTLSFFIDENPQQLSTRDYYQRSSTPNFYELTEPKDVINISVGGNPALKFDPYITFAGGEIIVVPEKEWFLVIHDDGGTFKANGLLDKILATFKFAK